MDRSHKVLLVEDDASIRQALALLLGQLGYAVTAAASVAEGVRLLDGQGIALLDVRLGGEPGDAVLREIRRRGLPVRVAMMSAGAGPTDHDRLDECPPDCYFDKPLDFDALVRWIGQDAAAAPPA